MARTINWEAQIGRRVRLRDLYGLLVVAQCGSMAKAGIQLGVSQSAVSQIIADLEHALGVRLLDRGPRGVELTVYGSALLRSSRAAFDELRKGVQEIEFLTDPTTGEVRLGCPESISAAILPAIIQQFYRRHPRVFLEVDTLNFPLTEQKLRDRSLDLLIIRGRQALANFQSADDLSAEIFLEDELVVAAGAESRWGKRRQVKLAELAEVPWVVTPFGFANQLLAEAFKAQGLDMPRITLKTYSVHLRSTLSVDGPFVTALPRSVLSLYGKPLSLKALRVDLPVRPWPVAIVKLKNRSLSPTIERFIACARDVARQFNKVR
jgi:DNA-binding transcriptional LysR family regulator